MGPYREALTLGQLRSWAAVNEIPLTSVLKDRRGYLVACFWVEHGELGIIPSAVTDEGKTLADLMAWAAQEPGTVKDGMPLFLRTPYGLRNVVDLSHWEEQPGLDYLTLQEVWE